MSRSRDIATNLGSSLGGGSGVTTYPSVDSDGGLTLVDSSGLSSGDLAYAEASKTLAVWNDSEGGWYKITTADGYIGSPTLATGGDTVVESDGYRIHTFTSSGNFVVTIGGTIEYLVVGAGGGGGGKGGGCGGAGGYRTNVVGETSGGSSSPESTMSIPTGVYPITIGSGGSGGVAGGSGSAGGNSIFNGITSLGGGGGALQGSSNTGGSGGSGGGGGKDGGAGGSGTGGQGKDGGSSLGGAGYAAAGGGGADSVGGSGLSGEDAGDGGTGIQSAISGTLVYRSGGGGGGTNSTNSALRGLGGLGGGGDAGLNNSAPVAGTANTGGGGGGGSWTTNDTGAAGGSGIVIIRYLTSQEIRYGTFCKSIRW